MTYTLIEESIIDRLAPLRTTSLLVRALPDVNADYGEVRSGQVLLYFDGETAAATQSAGRFIQMKRQEWKLDIRLKQLRQHNSEAAYTVLTVLQNLLIGFQPNGAAGKISLGNLRFLGTQGEANYWTYEQSFFVPAIAAEEADPGVEEVLLKRIDYLFALEYSDGSQTNYPGETLTVLSESYEE